MTTKETMTLEKALRSLRRAQTAISMWENGYAFDSHGVSRDIQREIDEAVNMIASQPAEQPRGEVVDGETEYKRGYDRAVQHMADIWMDPSVRELRLVTVEARRLLKDIGERMSHGMREKWADIIAQLDKRMASSLAGLREAIAAQPKPEQAVGDVVAYTDEDVARCEVAMCSAADPDKITDDLEFNRACVRAVLDEFTRTPRPAVATPADVTPSVALTFLEEMALRGESLEGDDASRLKAITAKLAGATPAEVTDIISELGRMAVEGGVSMDAHDMSVMCSQLADRLTAQCQVRKDGQRVSEPPLAGRWHHGNGYLCCGTFRVARKDWEAGVCAAPGMRDEVFDWMCERLNASSSAGAVK